ncbi:MAG: ATP-grasp domain-containing protein [Herbinix sp.]|nr:ATP-grasp domain-containing protein [Herbinix sp.]
MEELEKEIQSQYNRGINICAIVSFSDPYCYTASKLAEMFGINQFSTEAIFKMQNKIYSRQVLAQTTYSPHFVILDKDSDLDYVYKDMQCYLPFVIKSPESAGSKDVIKINDYKEFKRGVKQLIEKYPEIPIMAEEFLDGPQYLVETIVYKKEISIIAIFHQEVTFQKRFIITGYNLLLNSSKEFTDHLEHSVRSIINAFGMETGSCHLEMRYVHDKWKLIEINPRISGSGMNKMIEAAFGINLVEETLKMALGQEPNLTTKYKKHLFCQQVTVSQTGYLVKVTGKHKALLCPGIVEVYIKPRKGALLRPPLSMGDRYAYIIATGSSEAEAKENAKYAASQIKFHLTDTMP